MAPATILYPVPELALLSAGVRRCTPAAVVVVTQLDTQLLRLLRLPSLVQYLCLGAARYRPYWRTGG
jgi:hypothetical protein